MNKSKRSDKKSVDGETYFEYYTIEKEPIGASMRVRHNILEVEKSNLVTGSKSQA